MQVLHTQTHTHTHRAQSARSVGATQRFESVSHTHTHTCPNKHIKFTLKLTKSINIVVQKNIVSISKSGRKKRQREGEISMKRSLQNRKKIQLGLIITTTTRTVNEMTEKTWEHVEKTAWRVFVKRRARKGGRETVKNTNNNNNSSGYPVPVH